ncbi:proline-specific peptidase [Trametes cingulata]|nr:proline-specific peptidase [Trametes cingulata]
MKEGLAPFTHEGETHQTYYKVFGELEGRTRPPVVVLHGGPGLTHDYTLPHADLANQSFPVVFYDQLGSGRSTHLREKPLSFWGIDLFLDELDNLLQHLGIQDEFHIVGQSWGGMMASEYVVRRHPKGLRRLVIEGSPADMVSWGRSFKALLEKFPQWVKDALAKGPSDRVPYWNATLEFYKVHGCRVQPFPEDFIRTLEFKYGENGDRTVDGSHILKGWTIVDRLHDVDVPTLVVNGAYDIADDEVVKPYVENIPHSKWVKFDNSSHTPFWEEREKYMQVVGEFLAE